MTTERELLPCPFCGGEAVLTPNVYAKDEGEFPGVECVECETLGPCGDDDADAVARWNRRAALAQPAQPSTPSSADAARYRFIRDRLRVSPEFLLDDKWLHERGIYGNLDAAIDAARGKP